jgi:hypothetical protein
MPVFEYRALQGDGKLAEGQLEADGRQQAFRQMEAKGLRPIRLVERGDITNTTTPDSPSNTSYILAWVAGGLFALSLFLPAVNLDPWLPGFNVFVGSAFGTVFFGLVSIFDGARNGDLSSVLGNFVTCLVGASANVLMMTSLFRIIGRRRVPIQITALTLALTFAAAGALCYRSDRSIDETLSFGYFAWAGCAALLMVASKAQPPPRQSKDTKSCIWPCRTYPNL